MRKEIQAQRFALLVLLDAQLLHQGALNVSKSFSQCPHLSQ